MNLGNHSLFRDTMVAAGLILTTAMLASAQEEKKSEAKVIIINGVDGDAKKEATEKRVRIRAAVADDTQATPSKKPTKKKQYRIQLQTDGEAGESKPRVETKEFRVEVHAEANADDGKDGMVIKTKGKVVIVGPDGKVQEYDLSNLPAEVKLPNIEALKTATIRMRAEADKAGTGAVIIGRQPRIIVADPKHKGEHNHSIVDGIAIDTLNTGLTYFIGIQLQPLSDALKAQLGTKAGILVDDVIDGSPAAKAGIKKFDVIASANGMPIKGHGELQKAIGGSKGKAVKLGLIRGGKKESVSVTPQKRAMKLAQVWVSDDAKMEMKSVQSILEQLKADGADELNLEVIRPGIVVKSGVAKGDLKDLKINDQMLHEMMLKAFDLSNQGTPHAVEIHRVEGFQHDDSQLSAEVETLKQQVTELQRMVKELKAAAKKTTERSAKSGSRSKKSDRDD